MNITGETSERLQSTLLFLRDVLSDYKSNKAVGYEVISLLLKDPKLKLLVQRHLETFYSGGLVKGHKL